MKLTPLLQDLTADGRLTTGEWQRLRPLADRLPRRASAEAREVLAAWASNALITERGARQGMQSFLSARGYKVPATSGAGPQGEPVPPPPGFSLEAILRSNITEPYATFERLSTAVCHVEDDILVGVVDGGFATAHPAMD
jgi:hypothetical protein